jgi:hypothetical protein
VAVDDFAQVLVNGVAVGTTGSVEDQSQSGPAQSSLAAFDITSLLVSGTNIITIRAANGAFGCVSGPYNCNPTGVVFGGSLSFQSGGRPWICHIPPGNPQNAHPISPNQNSYQAHFRHGDFPISGPDDPACGS